MRRDPPPRPPQILLLAFLKLIDEGSHMVMLECPDIVNTLLHEFLLWEPEPSPRALPEPPAAPAPAPAPSPGPAQEQK